jgi:hypothetical protein
MVKIISITQLKIGMNILEMSEFAPMKWSITDITDTRIHFHNETEGYLSIKLSDYTAYINNEDATSMFIQHQFNEDLFTI